MDTGNVKLWIKCYFWKLLGFNWRVPWPVHFTTIIKAYQNIKRGNRWPGASPGCYIDARNGIEIGNNVWIGPHVKIISMNHDLYDYSKYRKQGPAGAGRIR